MVRDRGLGEIDAATKSHTQTGQPGAAGWSPCSPAKPRPCRLGVAEQGVEERQTEVESDLRVPRRKPVDEGPNLPEVTTLNEHEAVKGADDRQQNLVIACPWRTAALASVSAASKRPSIMAIPASAAMSIGTTREFDLPVACQLVQRLEICVHPLDVTNREPATEPQEQCLAVLDDITRIAAELDLFLQQRQLLVDLARTAK